MRLPHYILVSVVISACLVGNGGLGDEVDDRQQFPERQLDRRIVDLLSAESTLVIQGKVQKLNHLTTKYGVMITEEAPFEVVPERVFKGSCKTGEVVFVAVQAHDTRVMYDTNVTYLFFLKPYDSTNAYFGPRAQYRAVANSFGIISNVGLRDLFPPYRPLPTKKPRIPGLTNRATE